MYGYIYNIARDSRASPLDATVLTNFQDLWRAPPLAGRKASHSATWIRFEGDLSFQIGIGDWKRI